MNQNSVPKINVDKSIKYAVCMTEKAKMNNRIKVMMLILCDIIVSRFRSLNSPLYCFPT